jgi:hypothetical protein
LCKDYRITSKMLGRLLWCWRISAVVGIRIS